MKRSSVQELLSENTYPGRGILLGMSPDGKQAVCAYFIMGRSENSRNRVFVPEGDGLRTAPQDPKKVSDPSLIIYRPVRTVGPVLIVTNGDQTDTICEGLAAHKTAWEALAARRYEPDAPNDTPRISGVAYLDSAALRYELSILKREDPSSEACARSLFAYEGVPGLGHLIHTYDGDADVLPSFTGEPRQVDIPDDIDRLTDLLWDSLDGENKISLFVRYTDLETKDYDTRIINRYEQEV